MSGYVKRTFSIIAFFKGFLFEQHGKTFSFNYSNPYQSSKQYWNFEFWQTKQFTQSCKTVSFRKICQKYVEPSIWNCCKFWKSHMVQNFVENYGKFILNIPWKSIKCYQKLLYLNLDCKIIRQLYIFVQNFKFWNYRNISWITQNKLYLNIYPNLIKFYYAIMEKILLMPYRNF